LSRPQFVATTPALALRRAQAAAACGVSVEVFDAEIRPHVPAKRLGGKVVIYPVAGLAAFLAEATAIADDLSERRAS
jgi:hypothetical protein